MSRATAMAALVKELKRCHRALKPRLVRLKYERMNADVFAFFRGTDFLFAQCWPVLKPPAGGPQFLICGDLHLENFGAYRAADGELLFDINDFDEALKAPCGYDVVRCTTSALLAAESWRLSPIQATGIALEFLDQYRAAVIEAVRTGEVGEVALRHSHEGGPVRHLLGATALGTQVDLLNHQTELVHEHRRIVRSPEKHPALRVRRAERIAAAVERFGREHDLAQAFRVLDVTGRIAGIGSLGMRRYLVLVEGGGSPDANWLLDLKEERASAAGAWNGRRSRSRPGNAAAWVVSAQQALQSRPAAGLAVLAIGKRSYRMRPMVPEENRSSLDRLQKSPEKLRAAVGVAGKLAAWAHLRGSRLSGRKRTLALARWAEGSALDAVLASAVRYADRTHQDFQTYQDAYRAHALAQATHPAPAQDRGAS